MLLEYKLALEGQSAAQRSAKSFERLAVTRWWCTNMRGEPMVLWLESAWALACRQQQKHNNHLSSVYSKKNCQKNQKKKRFL